MLMWHLQDSQWKVPKLNVHLTLESVYAVATPLNVALVNHFTLLKLIIRTINSLYTHTHTHYTTLTHTLYT
jgi:hypothetical protein